MEKIDAYPTAPCGGRPARSSAQSTYLGPASDSTTPSATRPANANANASDFAAITRPLLETFTGQDVAEIRYSDQTGTLSRRRSRSTHLHYSLPVWYAVAWWNRLRNGRLRGAQFAQAIRHDGCHRTGEVWEVRLLIGGT